MISNVLHTFGWNSCPFARLQTDLVVGDGLQAGKTSLIIRKHYQCFGNSFDTQSVLLQIFEHLRPRNSNSWLQNDAKRRVCCVWTLNIDLFQLCASRRDDSNGAMESFWEPNGVKLWPFKDKNIINAKGFLITCWSYIDVHICIYIQQILFCILTAKSNV